MTMRKSATPVAAQPTQPSFDPSTWANQPRLLASNEAEGAAILCGVWAAGIVLGLALLAGIAWSEFGAEPLGVLIFVAVSVVIGVLVTLWRWATVYSDALRADTDETRRATWQREMDTGVDYNGDGVIGDPFSRVPVRREGAVIDEVIIPLPSNSVRGQPILDGWGVTAADLVAFLFEAETGRGLQERAWVGQSIETFVLPSSRGVTQTLFRSLLAALSEHQMASKPDGKWRLDVAALDVANDLKST